MQEHIEHAGVRLGSWDLQGVQGHLTPRGMSEGEDIGYVEVRRETGHGTGGG